MKTLDLDKLESEIERRIQFHQTNQNDPHNVGNAVIVALTEVLTAIQASKTGWSLRPTPTYPNASKVKQGNP